MIREKVTIRIYMTILLFFLLTGIAMGQGPIEKIGEDGLLAVKYEDILSIRSVALTSNGSNIAINLNREIWLYSLIKLKTINYLTIVWDARVGGEITFSPDNKLIACGDAEGRYWVWAISNGKIIETGKGFSEEGTNMEFIHSISFSNNGDYFAAGNAGSEVFLWDTSFWKQIRLFNHYGNAMRIRFSSDDKYLGVATGDMSSSTTGLLVDGSMEGKIVIWDWKANKQISEIITGGVLATALAFSPEGQFVAGGNTNGDIGVWRISDGSLITKLKGHMDRIYSLSFSSNGQLLVSTSEDNNAIIWDVKQSRIINKLSHNYRVLNAVFWQNNMLITADKKGVSFWDIPNGKHLGRLLALKGSKFIVYTSEGYYETDAPDYLKIDDQQNQQDSIKKAYHQPEMISRTFHILSKEKDE